jgi:mevalonate kinase
MIMMVVVVVIMFIIKITGGGGGGSIYNCIPETNHVSRVYTTDAVLQLQFMVHVM